MMPPEPYRIACLEVIYRAVLEARALAFCNHRLRFRLRKKPHRRIADLMDAIHNIPIFLMDWSHCKPGLIREYLVHCDSRLPSTWGPRLADVYDEALRKAGGNADAKETNIASLDDADRKRERIM